MFPHPEILVGVCWAVWGHKAVEKFEIILIKDIELGFH
jgi:hypothetical protein